MRFKQWILSEASDTWPYGKEHKGKKIVDLPADYIRWALDSMDVVKRNPALKRSLNQVLKFAEEKDKRAQLYYLAKVKEPFEYKISGKTSWLGDKMERYEPGDMIWFKGKPGDYWSFGKLSSYSGTTSDMWSVADQDFLMGKIEAVRDESNKVISSEQQSKLYDDYAKLQYSMEEYGEVLERKTRLLQQRIAEFASEHGLDAAELEDSVVKNYGEHWYNKGARTLSELLLGYANSYSDNSWVGADFERKVNDMMRNIMKWLNDEQTKGSRAAEAQRKRGEQEINWERQGLKRCERCGGAGGFRHWPGFDCFDCGGLGAVEKDGR